MSPDAVTLFGGPNSLYTGRARSYLIKAGIAYREEALGTPYFRDTVLPKAGGRASMPTVELPNGEVIRDGAAIIDHFEETSGHPFSPTGAKQNLISRLFDVIGAEGLLRPAMHYRWNFDDANLAFIRMHFAAYMPRVDGRDALADRAMQAMRKAAVQFGVVPETYDLVETLYVDLLDRLDIHFATYPHLLGNQPSIGDFGLIAPLYGHLGRDPKPLFLMQTLAVHVFRWVERMNRPERDIFEYENQAPGYLPDDEIPDTLLDVLKVLAEDFVPETLAAAACINGWLAEQTDLEPGSQVARSAGTCSFEVRGTHVSAIAQPYRFYLLKRVQEAYEALSDADRADVDAMLEVSGMAPILDARLNRDIGRKNNLEVWQ